MLNVESHIRAHFDAANHLFFISNTEQITCLLKRHSLSSVICHALFCVPEMQVVFSFLYVTFAKLDEEKVIDQVWNLKFWALVAAVCHTGLSAEHLFICVLCYVKRGAELYQIT